MNKSKTLKNKIQFSVHVDPGIFVMIEKKRGLVKRSTFIENILYKSLGGFEN
jgi:hypothetical protein